MILAHEDLLFEIVKAEAVMPPSHSVTILFHAAIVLTTAISRFALLPTKPPSPLAAYVGSAALVDSAFTVRGKFAFVLLAFNTILFFATGGYRSIFLRRTNRVALGIFLCSVCWAIFRTSPAFTLNDPAYDVLRYFSPDILEIELVGTLSRGFQRITYSSLPPSFSLLTLIVLFHIVLDEVLRRPSSDNWFPACRSCFYRRCHCRGIFLSLTLTLLAHPFLWLSGNPAEPEAYQLS